MSFEGPHAYSRVGGIASRVTGLGQALQDAGHLTHLWFVGDPALGHETIGGLRLHRWCQWISRHHPAGVYDGEEGKHRDLDWFLRAVGLRDRVTLFWNANNVFGFDRVPWHGLASAATITTVSRYMRQRMWALGVDALVVPNGLASGRLRAVGAATAAVFREPVRGRVVLSKVARWDPDKRWLLAVDTVAELKRRGHRPLLVARGGIEAHGAEVLARAARRPVARALHDGRVDDGRTVEHDGQRVAPCQRDVWHGVRVYHRLIG